MISYVTASADIIKLVFWRMGSCRCAFCGEKLLNNESATRETGTKSITVMSCPCGGEKSARAA